MIANSCRVQTFLFFFNIASLLALGSGNLKPFDRNGNQWPARCKQRQTTKPPLLRDVDNTIAE